MALRCLYWPTRSPVDAASMDNLCIVLHRSTVEHEQSSTAAMPRFAEDISAVVRTDLVVR